MGLPCFWSATILMSLHWLSASILTNLWFDTPSLAASGSPPFFITFVLVLGFQVAMWSSHAQYILVARELQLNRGWLWTWTALFLGALWQVPLRIYEDVMIAFDNSDTGRWGGWRESVRNDIFHFLDASGQFEIIIAGIFGLSCCALAIHFVRPLVNLQLKLTVRLSMLWICLIACLIAAGQSWTFLREFNWFPLVAIGIALFVVLLPFVIAMLQKTALMANAVFLVFWIGIGFMAVYGYLKYPQWHLYLERLLPDQSEYFLFHWLSLFCGFYFGQVVVALVRAADRFPPVYSRAFKDGRLSRRQLSGMPAGIIFLLVAGATLTAWHTFSKHYHLGVLIAAENHRWEKSRIVAESIRLHRELSTNVEFSRETRGRFVVMVHQNMTLAVDKPVARDPTWASLVQRLQAIDPDSDWLHAYPQDDPSFLQPPHFSVQIDIAALPPNLWPPIQSQMYQSFHGGYWNGELVDAVRSAGANFLYLHEPRFERDFPLERLRQFDEVAMTLDSMKPILEQPDFFLRLIMDGVSLHVLQPNIGELREQLRQTPQIGRWVTVSGDSQSVELRPRKLPRTKSDLTGAPANLNLKHLQTDAQGQVRGFSISSRNLQLDTLQQAAEIVQDETLSWIRFDVPEYWSNREHTRPLFDIMSRAKFVHFHGDSRAFFSALPDNWQPPGESTPVTGVWQFDHGWWRAGGLTFADIEPPGLHTVIMNEHASDSLLDKLTDVRHIKRVVIIVQRLPDIHIQLPAGTSQSRKREQLMYSLRSQSDPLHQLIGDLDDEFPVEIIILSDNIVQEEFPRLNLEISSRP